MAATCRYRYDPLDRLATCAPTGLDSFQRFYCQNRLATEIQGVIQRSFLQAADRLLAQHQTSGPATLLTTDQQGSVLNGLTAAQQPAFRYTPYGLRQPQTELLGLSGFNGERPDPVTGHYLLGNGYRAFNPVLMRFNSPDNLSPFGDGGLNAYAYCVGDPVNRVDPTGHTWAWVKVMLRAANLMKKSPAPPFLIKFTKTDNLPATARLIKSPAVPAPQESKALQLPRFLRDIPQSQDVPQHLRALRPLPEAPTNVGLQRQWSGTQRVLGKHDVHYDLLEGRRHHMRLVKTPLSNWRGVLEGITPMEVLDEARPIFYLLRGSVMLRM